MQYAHNTDESFNIQSKLGNSENIETTLIHVIYLHCIIGLTHTLVLANLFSMQYFYAVTNLYPNRSLHLLVKLTESGSIIPQTQPTS